MPEGFLFIHGWATDVGVWDNVAPEFSGYGECLKVALPGHGGKGRWLEPTIDPAVRAVEEAAKDQGALVGVGWSLGALALLLAAARNPSAFKALVLVGATPRFVSTGDFPHGQSRAVVKRMILDMKKDPSATVERFYALNFTEEELSSKAVRSFIERYKYPGPVVCSDGVSSSPGCYPAFNYEDITRALEALYNTDLRAELTRIKTPVLLIHGDKDKVCPVEAGRFLAENIEGAELKVIVGAGHAPFIAAKDEFVSATKKFLDRV